MKTQRVVFQVIVAYAFLLLGVAVEVASGQITVNGGNITLAVTTAFAGSEPMAVTNTITTVRYQKQAVVTKITVATICPGQKFNLGVSATAVGGGTPAPQVTLMNGMLATDFITGIPPRPPGGFLTASLQYVASSTFAQGNSAELGDDVHTVTYTLIAQ
ncbi:MAG: hypothetical protein WEB33_02345 [Bacteroidota bacterium]